MVELSEQIALAAEQAAEVSEYLGDGGLDYSAASLTVVDRVLSMTENWSSLSPNELDGLVKQFSCYVLEVARREFGGRYLWHDRREQPVLVVGEPDFRVAILAWDKVRGRVGGDEGDNIPFFYAGFAERARKAVPGTDALYV